MSFYRLFLLSALLLVGCSGGPGGPGGSSNRAGYFAQVRSVTKACQAWLNEPKNVGKLKTGTQLCQSTLQKYAGGEVAKSSSYRTLEQLKMALDTSQEVLASGGDPAKVAPDTGICPTFSVKQVVAMVEQDLANEEAQKTPSP